MDTRDIYKLVRELGEERDDVINLYDSLDIELSEDFVIETGIIGFTEDGVIVHLDEDAMEFLDFNGVLLESEEAINEDQDSSDAVYNAVLNRIARQHTDLLSKYGPEAVMRAVEDIASSVGELDEIGSSDVSIWTKQAIEDLERGAYKHLDERSPLVARAAMSAGLGGALGRGAMFGLGSSLGSDLADKIDLEENPVLMALGRAAAVGAGSQMADRVADKIGLEEADFDNVDMFKSKISKSNDPFGMIYNALTGDYGEKTRLAMQEMYDDIVIDSEYGLHPDDDFEKIINIMVDQLEDNTDHHRFDVVENDELTAIKKLALGEAVGDYTVKNISPADSWKKHTDPKKSKSEVPVDPKTGKTLYQKVQGLEEDDLDEAEYQGRKVQLNKPMAGDVAKSKVYVKKPNGKVVKVNFGDKNMRIKKSNPARRKSFRARHNCENPGPKWKARYWSCRAW